MIFKNKRVVLKKITAISILLFTLCVTGTLTYAEATGTENHTQQKSIIQQQAETEEMKKLEDQLKGYSGNGVKEIVPQFDPQKIIEDTSNGSFKFSFTGIINQILKFLFKEVYSNISVLIKLVVLVIFCSILKNLQTSFLSESVGELAFYACYIVIVSVMVISLGTALSLGIGIIDNMVDFMNATIPVMITLLVSGGNITSAGIFQPIMITVVEVSATLIRNVLIPLISLSVVLSIVDNISEKIQISRLAGLFRQITLWALGLMLTILIGVLAIQGSVGAVADGVSSKTAKFAIGAFIPVAGKYLADAADTVLGCALIIRNASGIAVMIGILAICVVPLLKILALIAIYRITCVFIEPIADKRITNCINEMANALTFILGITASVAVMFLISVTAMIGASNISAMIR